MSGVLRSAGPAVNSWNAEYLEQQYRRYQEDPSSVPADLVSFFRGFDLGARLSPEGVRLSAGGGDAASQVAGAAVPSDRDLAEALRVQYAATAIISAYRRVGHVGATIDPFGRAPDRPLELTLGFHCLEESDLDRVVSTGTVPLPENVQLRELIDLLERTYCGNIGVQFNHISSREQRVWIADRCEREGGRIALTPGERVHILEQLTRSEMFEKFLGSRYQTEKRFSLEGGDSLIPLLDRLIESLSGFGAEEIVFGMSHRGRLNVLNNILGKSYEQIFTEFEDSWELDFADGGGDVKYHRGYSGERPLPSGKTVHLAMASNPSHLESVNPVVLGRVRGKQYLKGDTDRQRVIPVLLHGDAAVIGQGIVQETLNLSQLEGYGVGGTIHVVVNNLIGFTTGPEDGRSTRYCTDVAMMVEAPVFHVNGEDPEAVVTAAQLAAEFRMKFKRDVFIDLVCYRRWGHNEVDEASFTQPILAKMIKDKRTVLDTYAGRLREDKIIGDDDLRAIRTRLDQALEEGQQMARRSPHDPTIDPGSARWKGFDRGFSFAPVETGVPMETLEKICRALGSVPESFHLNPKLKRLLKQRAEIPETEQISYADAESLAFGSLLLDGHMLRLSGQDCRRGTFSHRHAVLRDVQTGEPYCPLNHIDAGQARFKIYDSPLSEMAVLGFEYGFSLADPGFLVMWEAQFGDFVNGAQVIIDQYLTSAEAKWERWSGLVLLLPHGYEGAGPEHSSARMERFLQLCGGDNIEVVYPSTAAQCFHMFRRRVKTNFRKPLVVMTPKSMLRVNTSTIGELTVGSFRTVLDDPAFGADRPTDGVRRVVLCTGKVYYELNDRREAISREDVAIIRVEQLYPFDKETLRGVLDRYPSDVEVYWVQEEPRNAGAYMHVSDILRTNMGINTSYVGREISPTPAVGSKSMHKKEQELILSKAVGRIHKDAGEAPSRSNGSQTPEASGSASNGSVARSIQKAEPTPKKGASAAG